MSLKPFRFLGRHPRLTTAGAVLAVGLVVFVLVWFEPQQLFIDKTVNEAPPGAAAAATSSPRTVDATAPAEETTPPAQPPQATVEVLASGSFRSLEHGTTGTADLIESSDGALTLRLENLDTSNGPDLRVYLSEIPASDDWHAYGERFIDLGALKGNRGNQNYAIPRGTDLSKYRSAVIWCRRFKVGFGVAGFDGQR